MLEKLKIMLNKIIMNFMLSKNRYFVMLISVVVSFYMLHGYAAAESVIDPCFKEFVIDPCFKELGLDVNPIEALVLQTPQFHIEALQYTTLLPRNGSPFSPLYDG